MTTTMQTLAPSESGSVSRPKINENFAARHTLDSTVVTAAMSPYTVVDADQALIIDNISGNVAIVVPLFSDVPRRVIHLIMGALNGHSVTTTATGGGNINGASSLVVSTDNSWKELYASTVKWHAR